MSQSQRRPADRQGALGARRAGRGPGPGPGRARSTSSSPRFARRSAAAFPTAGSIPAIWSAQAMRRHAADHDQRARPDLLHLRRSGIAVPQVRARSGRRGERRPGDRDPAAGRGRLQLARPARLHRQRHQPELAARSGRARSCPTPTTSWRPACSATCAWPTAERRAALLVPDAAVRTDQARKIVLVVGKDGTVAAKPVETGPLVGWPARHPLGPHQGRPGDRPGRPVRHAGHQGEPARDADQADRNGRAQGAAAQTSPSASQATLAAN